MQAVLFVLVLIVASCSKPIEKEKSVMTNPQTDSTAAMRFRMVDEQIVRRGVRDSLVLNAVRSVPRHLFVPKDMQAYAYDDEPLPIGCDQTISQPYIVATMTESLRLKGGEKVLEIGTGSGYQAAVLSKIARSVFTMEIVEPLALKAASLLKKEGYANVFCRCADGFRGWPEQAPFDAIMVTAAPKTIPQPLIDQLAEGGRMVLPVGEWTQELVLLTKTKGKIDRKILIPVRFVPMTGEAQNKP
jgi:protein-L-isoaspartate(D-aspartate) O-methyltransferase